MTVLAGYLAGKCGHAPLNLAVEISRSLKTSLFVTAVVPRPWMTPSPARVDAEFAAYADQLAAESEREARQYLDTIAPDLEVGFLQVSSRTAGDGLLDAVERVGPDVLVVGSSSGGALGQVVLGSTTDWLLHASPVPVALSPRGYRGSRSGALGRITCAYSGTPESVRVVERVAALTATLDLPLRVVSYAIRGRTMFPPQVGLHAEDSLLDAWASQLRQMTAKLKSDNVVGEDVELQVITGNGWDQALDNTVWEEGDVLALGTTSRRDIKGVFLGSHGAKIIRHSPVPVLMLPA
ncbi:MAG: universal stress protein [Actinomycetia bacterium]|nr:universal stress protein [Actinomycetes bacterium]MCH9708957.1 universal stress protein [Actinomycetes bacterium]MCH9766539.1 universal stress protein [Actinomycetes bacterium]